MNSEHNEDPPKIVDNSYSKVFCRRFGTKVIIEKSRGEVSLMEQDTIENVS